MTQTIAKTARIEVFDPAMCCSTGVCGTDVDQNLVTFAADAAWAPVGESSMATQVAGSTPRRSARAANGSVHEV